MLGLQDVCAILKCGVEKQPLLTPIHLVLGVPNRIDIHAECGYTRVDQLANHHRVCRCRITNARVGIRCSTDLDDIRAEREHSVMCLVKLIGDRFAVPVDGEGVLCQVVCSKGDKIDRWVGDRLGL